MRRAIVHLLELVAALALATCAAAQQTYTLRLSTWGAPTAPQVTEFVAAFKTDVEKSSNGRIVVQYFPAGTLVNERNVPSAIQSGVVDISLTTIGSWSSIVPTAGALNTIFFRPTAESFTRIIGPSTPLFRALDNDMSKHSTRLLAVLYNGPVVVVSRFPLRTAEDFKGKTVRVFDRLTAEIVQTLHGAPSTIEVADVYPALQRGTVQAAIGGLEGAIGLKEYEVGKYLLATNGQFGLLLTGYVMSKRSLEALPMDLQNVVLESGYKAAAVATAAMIAIFDQELLQMQEHGMTVTKLEPGTPEYQSFADSLAPLVKTQEARFAPELVRQLIDAQH
jgi:TRAP-type transport system periplasmic protein